MRCGSALVVGLMAWGSLVQASMVVALDEPTLTRRADNVVVLATIVQTRAVVRVGGQVSTRALAQVYRSLGAPERLEMIEIEVPGARLGNGKHVLVAGSPALEVGDVVIGFLVRRDSVFRPLGMQYGLLQVQGHTPETMRVRRVLDGLHGVDRRGRSVSPAAMILENQPLETFWQRLVGHREPLTVHPNVGGEVAP